MLKYITKNANAFRTRFAREKKGEIGSFSGESPKMNHIPSFFASEATKNIIMPFLSCT
jgi:hypothetical protein